MTTNAAYKGLRHPMAPAKDSTGYVPDFSHRYTTEDVSAASAWLSVSPLLSSFLVFRPSGFLLLVTVALHKCVVDQGLLSSPF